MIKKNWFGMLRLDYVFVWLFSRITPDNRLKDNGEVSLLDDDRQHPVTDLMNLANAFDERKNYE